MYAPGIRSPFQSIYNKRNKRILDLTFYFFREDGLLLPAGVVTRAIEEEISVGSVTYIGYSRVKGYRLPV